MAYTEESYLCTRSPLYTYLTVLYMDTYTRYTQHVMDMKRKKNMKTDYAI